MIFLRRLRAACHPVAWLALVSAVTLTGCFVPSGTDADAANDTRGAEGRSQTENESSGDPEDWFEAFTYTGTGDDVIELPEGVEAGIITVSHDGSHAFIINGLDANNESTLDPSVLEIGAYEGAHAFGLGSSGNAPAKFEIEADGSWELVLAHLSTAPVLELPVEDEGDAVYQYETGATEWNLTFEGDSAFIVNLSDDPFGGVLEMGPYEGTIAVSAGAGILTVTGNGPWSISEV
jgi:hypothetical protein